MRGGRPVKKIPHPSQLGISTYDYYVCKIFNSMEDKTIFLNLATFGHKIWIDIMDAMITSCWNLQTHENDVVKLYLFTSISSASVMANLRDIK